MFYLIPVLRQKFFAMAQNLKTNSCAVWMIFIHLAAAELEERTAQGTWGTQEDSWTCCSLNSRRVEEMLELCFFLKET